MKEKCNLILYLVWFTYLILSAILMFGHGFLLSRKTLNDVSDCISFNDFLCNSSNARHNDIVSCTNEEKIQIILSNFGSPVVCSRERSRLVLILVDALRYDFTDYKPSIDLPLPYQNRLPVIRQTMSRWPERTRLFRFLADPPTTTLQRVKALVTGSLPTFVDASSNFAAMELHEDNIINQVTQDGGKAILLGDDTWTRLLPGKWLRSHDLYSFHTWDLDTVDTEVDSKIYDELQKDDWDLLVAHYLGVDHAGHRYGPNHPEMTRKLNETNIRLQKIIDMLPSDALLYVIGDHGMTETGDHGGESKAERTAAFFAYSRMGFGGDYAEIVPGAEVQQTDFAPTLSAALGRPPPAPSLGQVLIQALKKMSIQETMLHLNNNLKQIMKYLIRYGEESHQVSLEKLTHLINATREQLRKAPNVHTQDDLMKYDKEVRHLVDNIRGVFREVWVEFDSLSMLRALLLLLLAIFSNWLIAEGVPVERLSPIFSSSFVPTGIISVALCFIINICAFYLNFIEDLEHAIILSTGLVSGTITCVLIIMHWDGISQRWYEGRSKLYERFSRVALVASAVVLTSNSYVIEEGAGLSFLSLTVIGLIAWNTGTFKALALWICCGIALTASRFYRGCREEQGDCWNEGKGTSGEASRSALILALGSMAIVIAIARRHIGWRGHGLAIAGFLTCAHWAVGWGSLGSVYRSRQLARGSWLVLFTMFLLLWKREERGATLPLMALSLLLYVANALVLGAALAPPAALALFTGFLALNIISMNKNNGTTKFSLSTRCNLSVACLWALLGSYQFYATGHHATLGHVRWAPAFHAGDPVYLPLSTHLMAALVCLELFGMPLLFGAAVPLLALWGPNGAASVGPRTQLVAVFSLCLKYGLCFAVRIFVCALSATIHCRHLMIWGVFTPKLLFETGACAAALLGTLIGASLAAWHIPSRQRSS